MPKKIKGYGPGTSVAEAMGKLGKTKRSHDRTPKPTKHPKP